LTAARRDRPPGGDTFFDRVYAFVRSIPRGRVITYGGVAALLDRPRGARAVGWALRALGRSRAARVPWHRVLGAGGRISLPGDSGRRQRALLRAEGVRFRRACVDMERHGWLVKNGPRSR
jgi:methylated-DNA-protein-cysteine methyltransferase-like protein